MKAVKPYSIKEKENREILRKGMKDGIPIALGYLAVSFSLGIAAKHAGLNEAQGFIASLLCTASAGEYVGFTLIGASATFIEIALATLVANARYILMSCAMSQRLDPKMPFFHRFLMALHVTDEIFGISIARDGYLNPNYSYGAAAVSVPAWAIGTSLGILAGNILPARLVSAFSVALYGMFLAIIIPPARKNKVIAGIIIVCFTLSFASNYIPYFCELSEGMRTIILTVLISTLAALIFPKKEDESDA